MIGIAVELLQHLLMILVLILVSSFFSISEIALAGARKIKLKLISEGGDNRADKIMHLQKKLCRLFCHKPNRTKCGRHPWWFGG